MHTPRLLLIGLIALISFNANADVYKTKDSQGRTVYTDQPAANDTQAKIVTLPSINQLPPLESIPMADPSRESAADISYKIHITSPAHETRLQANDRNLHVSISADQPLQPDHSFAYFLNGEKVKETTEQEITLVEPPRGENKLQVEVINQYGKSFGQSAAITVYVMRPIVKR